MKRILSLIPVMFLIIHSGYTQSARLTVDQFDKNIKQVGFVLVDIRTPREFSSGHIDKAINIDFYSPDFQTEFIKAVGNKKALIYCASGNRSNQALQIFQKNKNLQMYDLVGGVQSWKGSGRLLK
jgi:rhodanese-related sulfurtransferase